MRTKIREALKDRMPLIVGIGMIIWVHWAWFKLQENPILVPPEERREFPLVWAARKLKNPLMSDATPAESPSDVQQK